MLLDALPAAISGDVTSVHRARVASRRLRAMLTVVAARAGDDLVRRARRQVRRITRALGPVRELDVALGHLDEMGPKAAVPARTLVHVRRALEAERQRRRRNMLEAMTPAVLERLQATLAFEPPARMVLPASDVDVRRARGRCARRARELGAAVRRAGTIYESERLHAVRVAAKKLRYALEIERDLERSRAGARVAYLKRLQDTLGEIHDYEILLEHIRAVQADLAGADGGAARGLEPLVRGLEDACREGHAAFLRERSALLELCREIAAAAREGRSVLRG